MPYRPIEVANEFIARFGREDDVDHLKLQKLVYLANGWWTALKGRPLLSERPEVWRYGPVFSSLYNIFAGTGRAPIKDVRGQAPFGGDAPRLPPEEKDRDVHRLLNWIWNEYGGQTGIELSDLTHDIGTPWRRIAEQKNFRVPLHTEIPAKEDWNYFASLAKERGYSVKKFGANTSA